jgi:hypothetical protein
MLNREWDVRKSQPTKDNKVIIFIKSFSAQNKSLTLVIGGSAASVCWEKKFTLEPFATRV